MKTKSKMQNMRNTDRLISFPRPYPDPELFDSTLQVGFKKFPQREENYLRYKASERKEVLGYLPICLDIENVSRCNYRCKMCQVSKWPNLRRAKDMSFIDFKGLLDTQYGLIEIKLQGMGEPLLGKFYFEMIKYARSKHIWVRSTTNGSILHINDNYKRVIDADINEIQVSIDGVTDKVYKAIRGGGNLKIVMDNSILLNRYCNKVKRNRTRMWTVVQKENFHEIERFPVVAADLGFNRLSFSLDLNDWGQDRWRNINDQIDVHKKIDIYLVEHLVNLGKKHNNVEVTFWFIDNKFSIKERGELCPWMFGRAYISSDMKVVPCCMISNPEVINLGDARNFLEEWNAKEYQKFRRRHITGDLPDYCKTCYE